MLHEYFTFITDHTDSMVVTWVTINRTESVVEYGQGDFSLKASGDVVAYHDNGTEHRTLFMHKVTLTKLKPQQRYGQYLCLITCGTFPFRRVIPINFDISLINLPVAKLSK